jgi:hypothetical protein
MKRLFRGTMSAVLFTVGLGSTAFATTDLELVSGGDIIYYDGTTLDCNNGGTITVGLGSASCVALGVTAAVQLQPQALVVSATSFNGWDVSESSDYSNTPACTGVNGPGCINQDNVNASTSGAGTLSAYFASTGFTPAGATGLMVANASVLQTGTLQTQTAYANSGVVDPLSDVNFTPTPGGVCGVSLSSGIPGVVATPTSCAAPGAPFSLELGIVMTTSAGVDSGFNVTGNIAAVPEPAAVVLFGIVVAFCAASFRRRRKLS